MSYIRLGQIWYSILDLLFANILISLGCRIVDKMPNSQKPYYFSDSFKLKSNT